MVLAGTCVKTSRDLGSRRKRDDEVGNVGSIACLRAEEVALTHASHDLTSVGLVTRTYAESLVKDLSYRHRAWVLVLSLLAGSLWFARPLHAQGGDEPPHYRQLVRGALAEYHAKNFLEARSLFHEAHQIFPNSRTLRGLGMTAFELRSYRESISFLEAALASTVKPLEGSLRADTERLLRRAERFVGKLYLTLAPASATITLDGEPLEYRAEEPLVIDLGSHTLEFRAEGHQPETRKIQIEGRDIQTWSVLLEKLPEPEVARAPTPVETAEAAEPVAARAPAPVDAREEEKRPLYKSPWLWTGVGAVVVAAVVTGVVLATREDELAPIRRTENTPSGGVFSALEVQR